jgi:hypothetical protein
MFMSPGVGFASSVFVRFAVISRHLRRLTRPHEFHPNLEKALLILAQTRLKSQISAENSSFRALRVDFRRRSPPRSAAPDTVHLAEEARIWRDFSQSRTLAAVRIRSAKRRFGRVRPVRAIKRFDARRAPHILSTPWISV